MAGIMRVLATDIDGTLVGYGGEGQLASFLASHPELGVIYLTGRTRHTAESLIHRHGFPAPIALATDIGAEIYWGPGLRGDDRWAFQQRQDWSPRRVEMVLSALDGIHYLGRTSHWRLAFRVDDASLVAVARATLIRQGVPARTIWDSEDHRLDVLPRGALKGRALRYILQKINVKNQQCFVAGDAENDSDMLQGRYHGVLVGNGTDEVFSRLPERIWRAKRPGALGVLDGLRRWLKEEPPGPELPSSPEFVS